MARAVLPRVVDPSELHAVFRAARAVVATHSTWTKAGIFRWPWSRPRYTAAQALALVERGAPLEPSDYVAKAFEAAAGVSSVYGWNNHPRTTHADVLAGFDRAIAAVVPQG